VNTNYYWILLSFIFLFALLVISADAQEWSCNYPTWFNWLLFWFTEEMIDEDEIINAWDWLLGWDIIKCEQLSFV